LKGNTILNKKSKAVVQYILLFLLTALLIWLSLRGLTVTEGEDKFQFLLKTWQKSDKFYMMLVLITVMISHVFRAERWRMLLIPTGNKVSLGNSFLSLMVGYLVNLAIPRGGEVSRCYNLYKLENTPVEISFGTVVLERIVDVICLLSFVALSFLVEWKKIEQFIQSLDFSAERKTGLSPLVIVAILILIAIVVAAILLRKNKKLIKIFSGFKEGLLSIIHLKRKGLFIFYSIAIWGLYFLMSLFVLKAFHQTQFLGVSAVLTIFAIGSIAMAVPLPGGAGSYHTLVPLGLVMLYNLPKADAIAFVFIFHGWQTLIMIVGGILSLIISYFIIQWKQPQPK
jgi:uncharacterized protein (TIRG00374 family)